MRLYSRTNGTGGLVDHLYSIAQLNAETAYQRDMESYADGNRLFRVCSVCCRRRMITDLTTNIVSIDFQFKNERRVNTTLIVLDSSDDEDDEHVSDGWTKYLECYLGENDADRDEATTVRIRSKLRKKPRFLLR
jgi:hypothetical protein